MESDRFPSALYTLRAATRPGLDWPEIYRSALAAGSGECVPVHEERIAAVDELLSHSLRELLVLGELAALTSRRCWPIPAGARSSAPPPGWCDCSISRSRRTGATTATASSAGARAWSTTAAAVAAFLDRDPDDECSPLPAALDRGARCIADALVALPRDRIAVPGTWRRRPASCSSSTPQPPHETARRRPPRPRSRRAARQAGPGELGSIVV